MVKLVVGKGGLPRSYSVSQYLLFRSRVGASHPSRPQACFTFRASLTTHDISRIAGAFAMITRLSQEEARALLTVSRIGRLGCVHEGGPYVVPINYVLDGESIYVHSLPGRKLEALRANPRACLQVDEVIDPYHWRSAIAFGAYEEVTDPTERDRAVRALYARF